MLLSKLFNMFTSGRKDYRQRLLDKMLIDKWKKTLNSNKNNPFSDDLEYLDFLNQYFSLVFVNLNLEKSLHDMSAGSLRDKVEIPFLLKTL